MALHRNLTGNEMHVIHAFVYANATQRTTATGFVSSDVGKIAQQSDNNSYWILTDTAPTWTELTNTSTAPISGNILVGKSGAVDFNNIKDAVAQAVTNGASNTNPQQIIVYPGVYVENNPISIPTGVIVTTPSGERQILAIVQPVNPLDDLFIMTGGSLSGLNLGGVSDPSKALIHMSVTGQISVVNACSLTNCARGIMIENGAIGVVSSLTGEVSLPSSSIDHAVHVDGIGSRLFMTNAVFTVPSSILPSYVGNPINTCVHAANGSVVDVIGSTFQLAANDSNQISVLVSGNNSLAKILSCNFDGGHTAVKIDSSGINAAVTLEACTILNYVKNIIIDSSTGSVYKQILTDDVKHALVPGARLSGITGKLLDKSTDMLGLMQYEFDTGRQAPINSFIFDRTSSGLRTNSGSVTVTGGLNVNVSDGYGWVRRNTQADSTDVSWNATTLLLDANATNYVFFDAETLSISSSSIGTNPNNIQIATVFTNSTDVRFIHNTSNLVVNTDALFHTYLFATRKFALNSGLAASQGSTPTKITIDGGSYYITTTLISIIGSVDATFSYFYNNATVEVPSQTDLDITQYDNGGTLTTMTDGYFRVDTVYLTSDNRISLIYGTTQFGSANSAASAPKAVAPFFIEPSGISIANIIVEKNVGINTIVDLRPVPFEVGAVGTGSGITDHGLLTGLLDDDHPQYLLVSGVRPMSGDLNMGGTHNVVNVNLVDGVDVSAHASRHNPGQIDALATAAPVTVIVGGTIAEGTNASFARSDHQHGITAGTPVTIGSTNNAGTASTVSRSDHVHAHGALAGGTTHALVIADPGGTAGFMSSADKQKLDTVATGATNTPLTNTIPTSVDKSASLVGVSTEAARQDHKHNIDTASAGTINVGDVAAEGSATTLARSDHVHALTAPAAPANVDVTAAAAGSATTVARSDHKHNVNVGTPVAVGTTNSAGSATTLARSDHVHRSVTLQTVFAEISSDTTTGSATFVDLITQAVTTTGGDLIIHFTVSASATSAGRDIAFRITVDGTSKRGTQVYAKDGNHTSSAAIITKVTGLSAAAHTIKIQWRTSGGIAQILPVTNADFEHASLIISEVTL